MPSFLVTVIVAACVTLPALGLYVPRDDDTIEHQQCMNRSLMASVDLSRCMTRVLESGGNPDELYPDSPCPRCSHVCSKRDEVQECSRIYSDSVIEIMLSHRAVELSRFLDKLLESALSFFCRPDIIQFMGNSENITYSSQKLKSCMPIMFIGSPDDLCDVREIPMSGFEGKTCRYLVKVAECVETHVKAEKPELEEIMTAVINGVKDSDACGIHLQEIVDSEGD